MNSILATLLHALVQIFKKIIIKTSFYSIFPSKSHVGEWYFLIAQVFFAFQPQKQLQPDMTFFGATKNILCFAPGRIKGSVLSHTWKNNLLSRFFDAEFFISYFPCCCPRGPNFNRILDESCSWIYKEFFCFPQKWYVQHFGTNIRWHLEHFQNCRKAT